MTVVVNRNYHEAQERALEKGLVKLRERFATALGSENGPKILDDLLGIESREKPAAAAQREPVSQSKF